MYIAGETGNKQSGQAMLIAVFAIGGSLLAATAIAGFLMVYQIRQSVDAVNSTRAIMASDAGIERALYYFSTSTDSQPAAASKGGPVLETQSGLFSSSDVGYTVFCYSGTQVSSTCANASTVRSYGDAVDATRIFEVRPGGLAPLQVGNYVKNWTGGNWTGGQ